LGFRTRWTLLRVTCEDTRPDEHNHRKLFIATTSSHSSLVRPGDIFLYARRTRTPIDLAAIGLKRGYWRLVSAELREELEVRVASAGWSLVNCFERIAGTALGLGRAVSEERALHRTLRLAGEHSCDVVEIIRIESWAFLGVYRTSITAQLKRLQRDGIETSRLPHAA
jgi:hypothetical protein